MKGHKLYIVVMYVGYDGGYEIFGIPHSSEEDAAHEADLLNEAHKTRRFSYLTLSLLEGVLDE